jgi:hypothetical protein
MNKQEIVNEIKRLAAADSDRPPGEMLFASETGLRQHEWKGKYWATWGAALRDAGFEPNKWVEAFDDTYLIEKYIELIRELGKIPSTAELLMKTNNDSSFPSMGPFRRLGSKAIVLSKVRNYCSNRDGFDDVLALCGRAVAIVPRTERSMKQDDEDGFVYLIKSGRHYKIGRSVSVGQRERQLAIQLPEKAATVHSIRTDDPVGIEAYWHKRFESKRKNGEWFDLSSADIGAFKRRKFM